MGRSAKLGVLNVSKANSKRDDQMLFGAGREG